VPSLRQLLARHPALLLADTCSTRVEVALWRGGELGPVAVAAIDAEATSGLPEAVERVLAAAAINVRSLDAVAFCSGPGSVLGIRLAAATLRTWRAIKPGLALYGYASLPLLATAHPGVTIIADARRETWHAVRARSAATLERVPSADLGALAAEAPLGTPATFRSWSKPPADVAIRPLDYSPAALFAAAPDAALFEPAPEPDAFMHETPAYATWTPRVHQAPTA
jgi:tRNA threonylcarbamoyladenosine biosynthesis protein TsaB